MTKPDHTPPDSSPADRLAAVLRVLQPQGNWATLDGESGLCHHGRPGSLVSVPVYRADSKDDLALVVGMLSAQRRSPFEVRVHDFADRDWETDRPYGYAITAPAEVWLAALEAAVK